MAWNLVVMCVWYGIYGWRAHIVHQSWIENIFLWITQFRKKKYKRQKKEEIRKELAKNYVWTGGIDASQTMNFAHVRFFDGWKFRYEQKSRQHIKKTNGKNLWKINAKTTTWRKVATGWCFNRKCIRMRMESGGFKKKMKPIQFYMKCGSSGCIPFVIFEFVTNTKLCKHSTKFKCDKLFQLCHWRNAMFLRLLFTFSFKHFFFFAAADKLLIYFFIQRWLSR